MSLEATISKRQKDIRSLELEIRNLSSIQAAEKAAEAQKNSWTTWLLSPIYKQREESEDERVRKDIQRQERRIEKDMKERRLHAKVTILKTEEEQLQMAAERFRAADLNDSRMIQGIHARARARAERRRQEKLKAEDERVQKVLREQRELRQRKAAESARKYQADLEAQRKLDEESRRRQPVSSRGACTHAFWWNKVQGRRACPECRENWSYLLQCPGCALNACPRCQAALRPRLPRREPHVRLPSPIREFRVPDWNDMYD